jgi:hypothetical protein
MTEISDLLQGLGLGDNNKRICEIQEIIANIIDQYLDAHHALSKIELKAAYIEVTKKTGPKEEHAADRICSSFNPWIKTSQTFSYMKLREAIALTLKNKYGEKYQDSEFKVRLDKSSKDNLTLNSTLFYKSEESLMAYVLERLSSKPVEVTFEYTP